MTTLERRVDALFAKRNEFEALDFGVGPFDAPTVFNTFLFPIHDLLAQAYVLATNVDVLYKPEVRDMALFFIEKTIKRSLLGKSIKRDIESHASSDKFIYITTLLKSVTNIAPLRQEHRFVAFCRMVASETNDAAHLVTEQFLGQEEDDLLTKYMAPIVQKTFENDETRYATGLLFFLGYMYSSSYAAPDLGLNALWVANKAILDTQDQYILLNLALLGGDMVTTAASILRASDMDSGLQEINAALLEPSVDIDDNELRFYFEWAMRFANIPVLKSASSPFVVIPYSPSTTLSIIVDIAPNDTSKKALKAKRKASLLFQTITSAENVLYLLPINTVDLTLPSVAERLTRQSMRGNTENAHWTMLAIFRTQGAWTAAYMDPLKSAIPAFIEPFLREISSGNFTLMECSKKSGQDINDCGIRAVMSASLLFDDMRTATDPADAAAKMTAFLGTLEKNQLDTSIADFYVKLKKRAPAFLEKSRMIRLRPRNWLRGANNSLINLRVNSHGNAQMTLVSLYSLFERLARNGHKPVPLAEYDRLFNELKEAFARVSNSSDLGETLFASLEGKLSEYINIFDSSYILMPFISVLLATPDIENSVLSNYNEELPKRLATFLLDSLKERLAKNNTSFGGLTSSLTLAQKLDDWSTIRMCTIFSAIVNNRDEAVFSPLYNYFDMFGDTTTKERIGQAVYIATKRLLGISISGNDTVIEGQQMDEYRRKALFDYLKDSVNHPWFNDATTPFQKCQDYVQGLDLTAKQFFEARNRLLKMVKSINEHSIQVDLDRFLGTLLALWNKIGSDDVFILNDDDMDTARDNADGMRTRPPPIISTPASVPVPTPIVAITPPVPVPVISTPILIPTPAPVPIVIPSPVPIPAPVPVVLTPVPPAVVSTPGPARTGLDFNTAVVDPVEKAYKDSLARSATSTLSPSTYGNEQWLTDPRRSFRQQYLAATKYSANVIEERRIQAAESAAAQVWMQKRRDFLRNEYLEAKGRRPFY